MDTKDVEGFLRTIVVVTAGGSLLNAIKNNRYAYVPVTGNSSGNGEMPYAVFNMSVDMAKYLCGKYGLSSFVFTRLADDGIFHSEYWEINVLDAPCKKGENEFIRKDECDGLKCQIPFSTLEGVNRLLADNMKHMIEVERARGNWSVNEEKILDFTINRVGMSPYLWRAGLIKGFYQVIS